jgi:PKD repeat protein
VAEESGHRLASMLAVLLCISMLMGVFVVMPEKAKALPDTATFQGVVDDGSNPVENAYVKTMLMMGNGVEINKTYTDASGFYSMSVPGGLQYIVFVVDGRYGMPMKTETIAPGETKWVNFTLVPISQPTDVMLMGFVHDELGDPRSDGIVLGAVMGPGSEGAPVYGNITTPNATGYFEINITAAPYGGGAIAMDFPGYPMAQNVTGSALLSGTTYWFNLTLQPTVYNDNATLAGIITEIGSGDPLENVLITVEVDLGMGNRYSNLTMTDAAGEYTMGLQSGNARITIQKIGYSMKMFDNYVVLPGANVLNAELKITEAKVRGNVTDLSSSLPMVNARVFLTDGQGNLTMAVTNETGYYELDAFVGTDLYLGAEQDGYSRDYVVVNISAGDELWLDFGIWPATAWLTGTVTDAGTGAPLSGVGIHIRSSLFETWTGTDGGGHYNVTVVAESYTIEAWNGNYWPFMAENVSVPNGVETVFDIAMMPFQNANLSGNVTDLMTGAPIAGAQVSAWSQYYYNSTMTNSTGDYTMGVAAGDYTVQVSAPGYKQINGNVHVDNFTDAVFNIALMPVNPPASVLLRGNVTESGSGLPVAFATVRVHFADRSYQNLTMANDSGYYEIYVPAWQIEITAWGNNHGPTFASTNLSGMFEYNLDLQLPPDGIQPMITSFSQVPLENISLLNPATIDITIEESNLKTMTLLMLRELNSSGTHSNYTATQAWTTSYDPMDPRNDLNPNIAGDNYTVHFTWTTAWNGAILSDSIESFYLPCMLLWNGSANVIAIRGYYSNANWTDVPGNAIFDFSTHAMISFLTDWMMEITMPDPSGVFKAVATVAEFSGSTVVGFENRVIAEMPVADISCSFVSIAASGDYKTVFSVSDWSQGNGRIIDTVVDNTPPTAMAGPDQNVIVNTTVTLDATGSYDNSWIAAYSWSYIDSYGSTVTLAGDVVTCSFNATGSYDVMLNVSDGAGWVTVDWVTITVGPDMAPTAVAGNDIWADEDTLVSFDGSGSSDDVGIVNYTWTIVELSSSMYDIAPTYTFAAPGVYTVELVVTDTIGQSSAADSLVVTVNDTTAPTADAGPSQSVNIGMSVTLNGSGSSDNVGIVNYTWSFTDSVYTELYGMEVSHTFSAAGTYLVTLTVTDAASHQATDTVDVVVNGPPVANAGSDRFVNVGSTVTFNGSGTSDDLDLLAQLNLTWTFTYNSGTQHMYGASPTFQFLISGQYTVVLNVTDTMGLYSTDTMIVTVNAPPNADAGPDQAVNVGATVTFDGSSSSDDLDALAQLNLTWTFSYGGSPTTLWGQAPSFQFLLPGTFVVTLTVTDTNGLGDTDTLTVTVNAAPHANAGPDQLVNTGSIVSFDGSGTTDDIDSLSALNLTWNFTYGGSPVVLYGSAPTFTFVQGGAYNVWLTVRDTGGLVDIDYVDITVNLAPSTSAGSDQTVTPGTIVTFDGSATTDDMDSLAQLNLTWTFTYGGSPRTIWGSSPIFQFSNSGTYLVTLTATDTNGLTDTDTVTVYVNAAPQANAGPDQMVNSGAVVTFNGAGTTDDLDLAAALNFTWNFTYGGSPVVRYGVAPTFTFSQGGVYDVTLVVRDTGGLVDVDDVQITVNLAPVARAGSDQDVNVGATVTFNASATTDDMDSLLSLNFTWSFTYSGTPRNLWGVSLSFAFAETGSYNVTLTVTDSNGLASTDALLVSVNGPPTASAGLNQTVVAGTVVTFNGSSSNDDGGASALNYTWNTTVGGNIVLLYTDHPTFSFVTAGIYTVTLTVMDAGGLTATDTMVVTVTPTNTAPVANAGSDQTAKAGDVVIFDGGASTDDSGVAGLNYTWEFAYQGRTERMYGPQPTFTFDEAGTYTVTLTVRDTEGLTSTDTLVVTVERKAESFVSQYWWSLAVIAVAAVALVILMMMKRKGASGSSAEVEESEEEEPKKKVTPPPDEEEL